ncbi:MAG TPA: hypothetical protein V6C96_05470 [Vampirovibrionales bacterium]
MVAAIKQTLNYSASPAFQQNTQFVQGNGYSSAGNSAAQNVQQILQQLSPQELQDLYKALTHQKRDDTTGVLTFFRKHVLKGFLERAMVLLMAVDFIPEILLEKNPKLIALKPIIMLGSIVTGLLGGEALHKTEGLIENGTERLLTGRDSKPHKESDWGLSTWISKTLAFFLITGLGIGKKMFVLQHKANHPKEGDWVEKLRQLVLEAPCEALAKKNGLDSQQIIQELRGTGTDMLSAAQKAANWSRTEVGAKNKMLGGFAGEMFEKLIGCPSLGKGKTLRRGSIAKDFMYKSALIVPLTVIGSWVFSKLKNLFVKDDPIQDFIDKYNLNYQNS